MASNAEKANEALVAFVGSAGELLIEDEGGVTSTVQVNESAAPTLAALSVERIITVCEPSDKPLTTNGDEQMPYPPPSIWHSELATPLELSVALNEKFPPVAFVGFEGLVRIVVIGGVVSGVGVVPPPPPDPPPEVSSSNSGWPPQAASASSEMNRQNLVCFFISP